jgi:hypothetical protein
MGSARCVAYIANILQDKKILARGKAKAKQLQNRISDLYLKNGKDTFDCPEGSGSLTPGTSKSAFVSNL